MHLSLASLEREMGKVMTNQHPEQEEYVEFTVLDPVEKMGWEFNKLTDALVKFNEVTLGNARKMCSDDFIFFVEDVDAGEGNYGIMHTVVSAESGKKKATALLRGITAEEYLEAVEELGLRIGGTLH